MDEDLKDYTKAFVGIFGGIILVVIFLAFAGTYLSQWYTKIVWGSFEYVVLQDDNYYYTHKYQEDSEGCMYFRDNYGKDRKWCEKYQVGEFYLHGSNPNWKTVIFGY